MLKLHQLSYSPWSERARWALDHHGLKYRVQEHVPMVGEWALRLRERRFSGRATVPLLLTPEGPIGDSTEIARYADRVGSGAPLIPREHDAQIVTWVKTSDRALEAGRALVTRRTGASVEARRASVPRPLRALGPVADALAKSGVAFFTKKYALAGRTEADDLREIDGALSELQRALAGKQTLLPTFSFADIVMSGILQLVEPVDSPSFSLSSSLRGVWTTPELRDRYADLLAWRDRLYRDHRKPVAK